MDAQTPAKARRQFGYNNDFLAVLPLRRETALMFSNHEYTNEELMFPTGAYDEETQKRIAMASHGLSVVEAAPRAARRARGRRRGWTTRYNRRFHTGTPFRVDGPAAGHPADAHQRRPRGPHRARHPQQLLRRRHALGHRADRRGEHRPVLRGRARARCRERYAASYARYGIQAEPERGWGSVDHRFDLSEEPHEAFRFGWIVEVDPYDKKSTPRKHTMLGRFKHEGANVVVSRSGHAVAYMGDDEKGEYLYKFVSADTVRTGRSARASAATCSC